MSEKDTKNLVSLADKEDELDDLLDTISGVFAESVDWLEDNFS